MEDYSSNEKVKPEKQSKKYYVFDESGSKYQNYPTLEVGYLSEAEQTSLKELITQSSSIHGGEDKDVRHVYHEQEDVEVMCKAMGRPWP